MTRATAILTFLVGIGFAGGAVSADDPARVPAAIPVAGASEPEKVPYDVKYGMFISLYEQVFRNQLLHKLPAEDDAILSRLAAGEKEWLSAESRRYEQEILQLCAVRHNRDAVSLAVKSEQIAADSNARRAARYRQAIALLSGNGRRFLEDFIEVNVASRIATSLPNTVEFAKAHPDEFLHNFALTCHSVLTGELPAEVRESIERYSERAAKKSSPHLK